MEGSQEEEQGTKKELLMVLYLAPKAAITKYYKLGDLKLQIFI